MLTLQFRLQNKEYSTYSSFMSFRRLVQQPFSQVIVFYNDCLCQLKRWLRPGLCNFYMLRIFIFNELGELGHTRSKCVNLFLTFLFYTFFILTIQSHQGVLEI